MAFALGVLAGIALTIGAACTVVAWLLFRNWRY